MKIVFIIVFVMGVQLSHASEGTVNDSLNNMIEALMKKQSEVENSIQLVKNNSVGQQRLLTQLQLANDSLQVDIDSLQTTMTQLLNMQNNDRVTYNRQFDETKASLRTNQSSLTFRTNVIILVGICFLLLVGGIFSYLRVKIRKENDSLDQIRKAQDALQNVQAKMQEESIKLDNKLLEIAEQQMKTVPMTTNNATSADHSLALKVADEIVRIELNLSRMDPSIKGYKQLSKAVQRIKDNFQANGYEIVDMLGKPYNEGMRVSATFVVDETLPDGSQRITSITKPQVNYNGEMIQKAQITVSQNI